VRLNYRNNGNNQHWRFDEASKTIRSVRWSNRALAISGRNVIIQPSNSRWFQLWSWKDDGHLYNERGKVLDIPLRHGMDYENNNLIVYKKHGG
jgi:hypothetical protein